MHVIKYVFSQVFVHDLSLSFWICNKFCRYITCDPFVYWHNWPTADGGDDHDLNLIFLSFPSFVDIPLVNQGLLIFPCFWYAFLDCYIVHPCVMNILHLFCSPLTSNPFCMYLTNADVLFDHLASISSSLQGKIHIYTKSFFINA